MSRGAHARQDELTESGETIPAVYFTCSSKRVASDVAAAKMYRDMLRNEFAGVLRKNAAPGEWVQHQDGKWVKK